MRQSLVSIVFAAALCFECYALSGVIPVSKIEDGSLEQDTFGSLLSDDGAENGVGGTDRTIAGKTQVIVVADANLWKDLRTLYRGLSVSKGRAGEDSLILDRRDMGQSSGVIKKDPLRCMVGRVYRPCWEV